MDDHELAKYAAISRSIIELIEKDDLRPGMRIPSENEIRERYGVSNTTARKALQDLEIHGYATRIKGRGTFVRERSVDRAANKILSFTRNIRQAGRTPYTRVLHAGPIDHEYEVDILGTVYRMPGPLYKVHRLRFADDDPVLLEVRYITRSLCPGITDKDLAGSLYDIYREEYGLHLTEIKQSLSSFILDHSTMDFFDLTDTTPGILVESVTFCGRDTLLEMERSIYRGDVYRFFVNAMGGS